MQQVQVQIAGLPVTLVLFSNGCVAIVPLQHCPVVIEQGSPVNGSFFPDGLVISTETDSEEFSYRVAYMLSEYDLLKQWLRQQCLQSPF